MTKHRNCADCGKEFQAHDIEWMGQEIFLQKCCESCTEAAQKAFEQAENLRLTQTNQQLQRKKWESICPVLYRDTNPSQLHPKFQKEALNWQYGPEGLGLVGIAGIGKTRAAYLIIQRMFLQGYNVQASNAPSFAKLCVDQFNDCKEIKVAANKTLQAIYKADLWLLDDLGKQRMTERLEAELYAVLEHRSSKKLPTLWTANTPGTAIRQMFSQDYREPIMRRLTQFNKIVAVWETPSYSNK